PVIRIASEERWDCQACGVCCRGSIIQLSDDDLQKLRDQRWEDEPEIGGRSFLVRDASAAGGRRLAQLADGTCVFFTAEGRCRIHEKFGAEAKPLVCRLFPLQVIPHGKDAVLTLRRACPTAAVDAGRQLAEHLPEIERLLAKGELKVSLPPAATLEQPAWRQTTRVMEAAGRLFNDERFPPVRRVVHALLLAKLLERSKVATFDDRKSAELVSLLETSVVAEAAPYFANRQPPSSLGGLLFRLTATEYVRLHPDYRAPQGFFARGNVARTAWRIVRGRGTLPELPPTFPAASFATLNEPLGTLHPALVRPEIQRPLERYLATSAASGQYALANRGGWSIVQSIRALAMTFPIALYLLRWATAGREPTATDVANIVCALDRGQGYPALAGARYRMGLNLIESQGDLERLAVWYAR
ncbi:MAG: YkgJ family cysteine cluster protein, partial [Planctomycetia bacterium]|nr:YkgJ family cysteine cluster protein [Planctomycetia bacterium]